MNNKKVVLVLLILGVFLLSTVAVSAVLNPSVPKILSTSITSSNASSNRTIDNLYANWSFIGDDAREDATNWNKSYGVSGEEDLRAMAFDSNGNLYVVGRSTNLYDGSSGNDAQIKQFNASGNENTTAWNKSYHYGAAGLDIFNDIAIDASDNIFVVGSAALSGTDVLLKKLYTNGSEDAANWNKTNDWNSGQGMWNAVGLDGSGNVYVGGFGNNIISASSANDAMLKKFNASGSENVTAWNISFDDGAGENNRIEDIAVDTNGNVFAVGYGRNLHSGSTDDSWFVRKYLSNGSHDLTWNHSFSGPGADQAHAVAIDSVGNVYVGGYITDVISSTSGRDAVIKKFNASGVEDTTLWNISFTSEHTGDLRDEVFDLYIDNNDSVYAVGTTETATSARDWFVRKYNSSGALYSGNWNLTFSGTTASGVDKANSVVVDSNDDVFVGGLASNLTGATNGQDWWLKKFDAFTNNITDSEVRWYKNANEVVQLKNMTNVSSGNLSVDDVWSFGVRAFDGDDWTPWVNTSVNLTVLVSTSTSSSSSSSSSSSGSTAEGSSSSDDDETTDDDTGDGDDSGTGDSSDGDSSGSDNTLDALWDDEGEALVEGLSEEESYTFTFIDEQEHTATVSDIDEDEGTVMLTIESDPIVLTLEEGVGQEVDLDEDGESDLTVTLEGFNEDGTVDLHFVKSDAWIAADEALEAEELRLPAWVLPVVIVAVLVVLASVIVVVRKK